MSVAETILNQLGGNRFKVMTGAKDFIDDGNALEFSFPTCKAGTCKGVSRCRIELMPVDLYKVTFYKVRNFVETSIVTPFESRDYIYFNQLEDIFTECTGLYTSL
jgi:hypothetical protein